MEITFRSNKLARQLGNATAIKAAFGTMAVKVSARLQEIKAMPNLAVLKQLPQAACHELKGERAGEWAVRISANHRMIFILDHDPLPFNDEGVIDMVRVTDIVIIGTEDYH